MIRFAFDSTENKSSGRFTYLSSRSLAVLFANLHFIITRVTYRLPHLAVLVASLFLLVSSCKNDPKPIVPEVVEVPVVKTQLTIPAFSADSAYAHVATQVAFGPRVPSSDAHASTRAFIQKTMERYGAEVTVQDFPAKFYDGKRATGYNIIGAYNPRAKRRMFICAHYDTRPIADSDLADPARYNEPIPGADDGGSGVGVMLEIARQLHENEITIEDFGIDFVFFDLEDYGKPDGQVEADIYTWGLGSQHWAANPHVAGYAPKFGVLLDMVGAEGAVFGREQYSVKFAGNFQNSIWRLAKQMGRGSRFIDANIGYATDDHFFVNTIAGWPTVDIIYRPVGEDLPFGKHWHTHDDDLSIISKETLGDIGQVMTAVVYREAGNML